MLAPLSAQVIPPSPPVFGYEIEVAAAAGSGMGLYLVFGCLCCTIFGGRSMRARHHSRWPFSNQITRVDGAIPYAAEESRREGEFYDHLTKGQLPMRAEDVKAASTSSHAAFGTNLANMLFPLPAGDAASASASLPRTSARG